MAKVVPTKPADAKRFVKVAFAARRYEFDTGGHLLKRMAERKLTKDDLTHAIDKLVRIAEYPGSQSFRAPIRRREMGEDLSALRRGRRGPLRAFVDCDGRDVVSGLRQFLCFVELIHIPQLSHLLQSTARGCRMKRFTLGMRSLR